MNQKSLDKNKTKELEWTKTIQNSVNRQIDLITIFYSLKTPQDLDKLLTQQRKELLEEILNLECLKEEKLIDDTKVDCMILEKTWEDNDLKVIRNKLRKEIKEEIKKL